MRVCELDGRKVGLWGAGREALSAYRAISGAGAPSALTVVTDEPASQQERDQFSGAVEVDFIDGEESLRALRECEVVIRSPGISRYRPEVEALRRAGVRLTTATNLWMAEHPAERVLAVTGTKGKSTTSTLIAHLARQEGARVVLAGNIGEPLLDHLTPPEQVDLWVLELSSYQAADLESSPTAAVVLNLYPEHIDWHGSHERYYEDKLNVLRDRDRVIGILNARDRRLRELQAPENTVWFGTPEGYDARGQTVLRDGSPVLRAEDSPLAGEHNAMNLAAALSALEALELPVSDPAAALRDFRPLPHRLQRIHAVGRVSYIDDGISTTSESTIAALRALDADPIVLIAGGFDREQDYTALARAILDTNVVAVLGLPDTGPRLLSQVERTFAGAQRTPPKLANAQSMEEAVILAEQALEGSGVVLLSPAAPSYGAFLNFKERSQRFLEAVKRPQTAGPA